LTVTNQPPVVTGVIPTTAIVALFGKSTTYNLPTSMDPENLSYSTSILSGPSYVSLISNSTIKIAPTDCISHFGI